MASHHSAVIIKLFPKICNHGVEVGVVDVVAIVVAAGAMVASVVVAAAVVVDAA